MTVGALSHPFFQFDVSSKICPIKGARRDSKYLPDDHERVTVNLKASIRINVFKLQRLPFMYIQILNLLVIQFENYFYRFFNPSLLFQSFFHRLSMGMTPLRNFSAKCIKNATSYCVITSLYIIIESRAPIQEQIKANLLLNNLNPYIRDFCNLMSASRIPQKISLWGCRKTFIYFILIL